MIYVSFQWYSQTRTRLDSVQSLAGCLPTRARPWEPFKSQQREKWQAFHQAAISYLAICCLLGGPLPSLSMLAECQSAPLLLTRSQGAGVDVETPRKGVALLSTVQPLRATWLNSAPDAELCRPGTDLEHPTQACQSCNTMHLRGAMKNHLPHNKISTDMFSFSSCSYFGFPSCEWERQKHPGEDSMGLPRAYLLKSTFHIHGSVEHPWPLREKAHSWVRFPPCNADPVFLLPQLLALMWCPGFMSVFSSEP